MIKAPLIVGLNLSGAKLVELSSEEQVYYLRLRSAIARSKSTALSKEMDRHYTEYLKNSPKNRRF